ncbi:hypothetical protein C0995_014497 [Termitomyces sp. Mi166|nr:hypothetical protein C0995_014497 [Termitomyces sp. Mi166\
MSDDEVPPPYSEQELDRKITRALVISAQQHQPQQDPTDDGEWEQWDEAVFAAAEARRNRMAIDSSLIGSSGAQTCERHQSYNVPPLPVPGAVQPLRIHKRDGSSVSGASGSWMGNVISEESSGSSSSGDALSNERRFHHDIPLDSDDDRSIPPPPFTSVDPRMDRIVRLEYHPQSTPPSPLNSPESSYHLPLPPDSHLALTGQSQVLVGPQSDSVHFSHQLGIAPKPPRQSLPVPPRSPNYHLHQPPASVIHPHQNTVSPLPYLNQPTHLQLIPDRLGERTVSTHPLIQTQSPPHGVYLSAYKKTAQDLPSQNQSFTANALYQ